eukprot:TRINITY_DN10076_c0_g1_i1.p1 TRINITY_DN10076_c0_g1~~TRINITY_DN10076_c0_g1_i1.p1  ORF type:complete len:753 (+),score=186.08 TRINITY_DN10076_c0_g1_i1:117-2375(+)
MEREGDWRIQFATLRELFPQVDARLLRGAVLEHGSNLEAAADYILTECLPVMDQRPLQRTRRRRQRQEVITVVDEMEANACSSEDGDSLTGALSSSETVSSSRSMPVEKMNHSSIVVTHTDTRELEAAVLPTPLPAACSREAVVPSIDVAVRCAPVKVTMSPVILKQQPVAVEENNSQSPVGLNEELVVDEEKRAQNKDEDMRSFTVFSQRAKQCLGTSTPDGHVKEFMLLGNHETQCCADEEEQPAIGERSVGGAGSSKMMQVEIPGIEEPPASDVPVGNYEAEAVGKDVSTSHLSSMSSSFSANDVESLRDVVSAVRTGKEELDGKFAGVKQLFNELVLAEARAKQAKAGVERAGEDIQDQVADVKQRWLLAREANERRAGDINAEKAILAEEARELRSRLLRVGADKNAAGAAIKEVEAVLKAKIAAFKEEEELAEESMRKKIAAAKESLLVEETKLAPVLAYADELDVDDKECTKLREFLHCSGCAVDSLQAEVQVLVENLENLKGQIESAFMSNSGYVTMMGILPSLSATNSSPPNGSSERSWNDGHFMVSDFRTADAFESLESRPLLGGFRMALSSSQMVNSSIAGSSHSLDGSEPLSGQTAAGDSTLENLEMYCGLSGTLDVPESFEQPVPELDDEPGSASVGPTAYVVEGVSSAQQVLIMTHQSDEKSEEEVLYEAHMEAINEILPPPSQPNNVGFLRSRCLPENESGWELIDGKSDSFSSSSNGSAEGSGPPDVWMTAAQDSP